MARPAPDGPRIGLDVAERLDGQAEMPGGNLGERRLVPLPVRFGADGDGHAAIRLEAHFGTLVRRTARRFEEAGDAETAQATSRAGFGAPRLEARGARHGGIEVGHEAAGVDRHAHRGPVRKRGDQVLPPQVRRIPAEHPRRRLDGALDDVVGLGLARAAIGVDRHRVGEGAAHIHGDRGNVVDAALRRRGGDHRRTGPISRQVGAEIGDHCHVECQDTARRVERDPRRRFDVAALRAHHEVFRTVGEPPHRALQAARCPQQQDPLGIEKVLHPEATADIGRVELDALGRNLEDELGELAADAMQPLPRQFEVHRVGGGIVARDPRARFERHDDDTIVRHIDLDDVRGVLHRRGDGGMVAAPHMIDEIARRLVPQGRRALCQCGAAIDDRRQWLVGDLDPLRRFARKLCTVGHHEADRITDMADAAHCQRRSRRHDQGRHGGKARHETQALSRQVVARRHEMHARHRDR